MRVPSTAQKEDVPCMLELLVELLCACSLTALCPIVQFVQAFIPMMSMYT